MSTTGFVDWGLAERVAETVAGGGPAAGPFDQHAVEAACADATTLVLDYSRLVPAQPLPAPELIDRDGWTRLGLGTLRELSEGLERRISRGAWPTGPLAAVARSVAGAAAGAEAGAAVGYAARKVLGQYDLNLVGEDRDPRLVFVGPNLADAHRELGEDPALFLRWIAIHEVTHSVQFSSVEWLRGHLRDLLGELIDGASDRLEEVSLSDLAGRLFRGDPRRAIRAVLRGDLPRLLAGPEQTRGLDRIQATMSVIEGHAEHVMDAAATAANPGYGRLRHRLDARRANRSGLAEVAARLLGLDLKLRQYRLGKAFCDAIVSEAGLDALNELWRAPQALPSADELRRPQAWLGRIRSALAATS